MFDFFEFSQKRSEMSFVRYTRFQILTIENFFRRTKTPQKKVNSKSYKIVIVQISEAK